MAKKIKGFMYSTKYEGKREISIHIHAYSEEEAASILIKTANNIYKELTQKEKKKDKINGPDY